MDIGTFKPCVKKCKMITLISPEQLPSQVPVKAAKIEDIKKLLTKRFGEGSDKREDMGYYRQVLFSECDVVDIDEADIMTSENVTRKCICTMKDEMTARHEQRLRETTIRHKQQLREMKVELEDNFNADANKLIQTLSTQLSRGQREISHTHIEPENVSEWFERRFTAIEHFTTDMEERVPVQFEAFEHHVERKLDNEETTTGN
ncbi:hypothetical protein PR048_019935 [Dryococelus australis]|uniref:Uncharacterized protein n=1 Tax=Dryococelus australis TaxID=614101 RepID=A0ABQ9H4Z3_9NEOP|nr:hypothetical protein PR048_019935 [Dryococelus australis]